MQQLILKITKIPQYLMATAFMFAAQPAAADIDCEIIICMAGGFSPAECAPAHAEMIRRISPWPVLPPFGVCTLTTPAGLDGQALPLTAKYMDFTKAMRMDWHFYFRRENKNGDVTHRRVVHSCLITGGDQEISASAYRSCPISYSRTWGKHRTDTVVGTHEGSQPSNARSVRIRYADYEGALSYSEWYSY